MIALDTNVLVRYLVDDDAEHAKAVRTLPEGLSSERSGFICRVLRIGSIPVLQGACGFSRDRITAVPEEPAAAAGIEIEAADNVAAVAG